MTGDMLINREQALARERELEAEIERLKAEINKRDKMLATIFNDAWLMAAKIADFQMWQVTAVKGGAE